MLLCRWEENEPVFELWQTTCQYMTLRCMERMRSHKGSVHSYMMLDFIEHGLIHIAPTGTTIVLQESLVMMLHCWLCGRSKMETKMDWGVSTQLPGLSKTSAALIYTYIQWDPWAHAWLDLHSTWRSNPLSPRHPIEWYLSVHSQTHSRSACHPQPFTMENLHQPGESHSRSCSKSRIYGVWIYSWPCCRLLSFWLQFKLVRWGETHSILWSVSDPGDIDLMKWVPNLWPCFLDSS